MIKKGKLWFLLDLFVILFVISGSLFLRQTLGKFVTSLPGNVIGDIAFYVIESDYQTTEVMLDDIVPSDDEYLYVFSVSNFNDEKRLETNAEYEIVIRTTTNLNLKYKLYKNGILEDVFIEKNIVSDEDGMYYNVMKTGKSRFGFESNQIDEYILCIEFSKEYKSFDYQNIIDSIEINIISEQIVE